MAKQIVRRPIGLKFEDVLVERTSLSNLLNERAAAKESKLVSILTTNTPDTYLVIFATTEFTETEIDLPDEVITNPEAIPQADGNSEAVQ
jgi:hypothetical protein